MTNQSISGLGVNIISGTTVYGEVMNASEVVNTLNKVDTSTHNSVGKVKTSRPGMIDTGELTVDLNYCGAAEQDALRTMWDAQTVSTWMIVAPTSASGVARAWSFSGYISSIGTPKFEKEGNATMSFKVAQSGPITVLSTAVAGVTDIDMTDEGVTALTLSPTFDAAKYGYKVTTDLADTGVKVTLTYATAGEAAYVNNTSLATATPSSAITLGTASGSVIMVSVAVYKTNCVPKVTWIEVTHGYV
jgi:hypothetical protein